MDAKLLELVKVTSERTARGAFVWTAFDSEAFDLKLGRGHMFVRRSWTRDDSDDDEQLRNPGYILEVTDAQGRVVADVRVRSVDPEYKAVDDLFQRARVSALQADRVLEEMLQTAKASA